MGQANKARVTRSPLSRVLLMAAGVVALAVGVVGVVVPLLPTTPFLLLAAACFFRGSERWYAWLIRHRWFGSYIRNYREHRAMTRRAKAVVLLLLWGVIGYSAIVVVDHAWVRVLLGLVATGVTVHVLCLRTMAAERSSVAGAAGRDGPRPPGAWRNWPLRP